MTTTPEPGSTRGPEPTTGSRVDPELRADEQQDADADPGMLNPRSGAAAGAEASETYEDTDADPDNLNPRDLRQGVRDDG